MNYAPDAVIIENRGIGKALARNACIALIVWQTWASIPDLSQGYYVLPAIRGWAVWLVSRPVFS